MTIPKGWYCLAPLSGQEFKSDGVQALRFIVMGPFSTQLEATQAAVMVGERAMVFSSRSLWKRARFGDEYRRGTNDIH